MLVKVFDRYIPAEADGEEEEGADNEENRDNAVENAADNGVDNAVENTGGSLSEGK